MNDYETHEITWSDKPAGFWRLNRRDGRGEFWAEVIVGCAGTVIVHGDGPDMILRSWKWQSDPRALINWVATSSLSYLATKVACGKPWEYDGRQAAKDFAEYLLEHSPLEENTDEDGYDPPLMDNYDGPVPFKNGWQIRDDDSLPEEVSEGLREYIYRHTGDFEVPEFGKVISFDLQQVQAICQRLDRILSEEESST